MLALPVTTGMAGFLPALLLFTAYWIYMSFTALLMLEAALWMKDGENLLSMSKATLGVVGEMLCWAVYLFLLYALTTAYIAGGGAIVQDAVQASTGKALPEWASLLPLLLIFGFIVYKGAQLVDRANRVLMVGLVASFGAMLFFLAPHVQRPLLLHVDWKFFWMGISVVATSFGFHIIIPSLVHYMERDVKQLKRAILIGSAIPYLVYVSWNFIALGIIPVDKIYEGYLEGSNGVHLLTDSLQSSSLSMLARFFSFFAIVTSFLGVSLSLSDFLADGFKIGKSRSGRLLIFLLTFAPPLLIVLIDPRAFLSALEYAGAFGVIVLLALFPSLIVWSGRYRLGLDSSAYKAPGGKIALVCAMLLALCIILFELKLQWDAW